jgi:hypothetical protein
MTTQDYKIVVTFAVSLFFTGGCESSKSGIELPRPTLRITALNAKDVAIIAINSVENILTLIGNSLESVGLQSDNGGDDTIGPSERPVNVSLTENCTVDGTKTVTFSSGGTPSQADYPVTAGDVFSFNYSGCDEGGGQFFTGALTMSVDFVQGSPQVFPFSFDIMIEWVDFTWTECEQTLKLDGDLKLSGSVTSDGLETASLSGSSLRFTDCEILAGTLSDFDATSIDNDSTGVYSQESRGFLRRSDLAGSIKFANTNAFEGNDSNPPNTGVFLITGDSSAERIVVFDSIELSIELDEDGDGVFEQTIPSQWVELES